MKASRLVGGYVARLLDVLGGASERIREGRQAGFSGLCYSPDLRVMFTWSTDGKTFASDDDGATWIEQEGVTTETDEGAFVAGREPPFVPWFSSPILTQDDPRWHWHEEGQPMYTFGLTHRIDADITLSE